MSSKRSTDSATKSASESEPAREADEVRVVPRSQGEMTVWCVDLYRHHQFVRRIGSAANKWQATVTALNIADTLSVVEVSIR